MASLKVGVIGVGGIARTHMPGWEASPHAEVVAGCDVHEDVLQAWGAQHEAEKLVTNASNLFRDPDIDVIDVCTPNLSHADLTIAALDAGKHVLCGYPLAPTPADIRRMIEARDRSGKMLMTAQHFRFGGSAKAMKAEIDMGVLGDVYHAEVGCCVAAWRPSRRVLPSRN